MQQKNMRILIMFLKVQFIGMHVFHRSYLEMEKLLKIYVYEEGDPPMFHYGPCRSIYSTEGSVVMMVAYLYDAKHHDIKHIGQTVIDYVNVIAGKYPYSNRSLGADHFMLFCHD
ncbi:hypothetical protein GIB67_032256 [Kingdonia uniflora]|uniref:Uncharacterized protein n=1 Tax=Kingdonia uniflora TaxID=39325 RepID=A0A7J7MX34_9MAGN|nr:hypothetical protein GIB67_032256 [Kingdonia uniflora]